MQGPLRLLVAERPDAGRRKLLASLASTRFDLDVHSVDTGTHALEALGAQAYDCALIDARLPPYSGRAILREARALGVDTPIIMITDADGTGPSTELLEAGAIDCIARPEISGPRLTCSLFNALRHFQRDQRLAEAERSVARTILYDAVTRLPNRALFLDRLNQAVALATREGKPLALLLLDLNNFAEVNNSFGLQMGDRLLEVAAGRLRACLRQSDTVARTGDDEFAVLLPTGASLAGAVTAASKLVAAMNEPFRIDEQEFTIGVAIGIALHPLHGATSERLLRSAHAALLAAKQANTGFVVHSGDDPRPGSGQLALAHDLRRALEHNELELHYQPKICMTTRRICGVEALLRWRHRKLGMIFPDAFIPLAEQLGMMEPLTRWVLNAALEQHDRWRRQGRELPVSVNLSASTLHNVDFPASVESLMNKWQVEPRNLILEITESAIISDAAHATNTVARLHGMGVTISVDDFGTGYTSLAYIRKLPVTEIKVDKSFVLNMTRNTDDAVIVRTIVELGHNLGLRVVAEGVEDAETFEHLAQLGCNVAQGYYMSRPADPATLEAWLERSPWGQKEAVAVPA